MERINVSEQFRLCKTNCSFEAEFSAKINLREVYKVMEAAVKALDYEDPYTALWLQDLSGSTLEELGVIKDSSQLPPYNLANGARLSGGSMFDTVIAFRNALLAGDQESIGGRVLGALDKGIDSLVTRLAKSGAEYERAQLNATRNSKMALDVTSMVSREGDLDFTKAITDLKMLDYTNQATLSQAGKMYSSTLLNYMR